VEPNYIPAYEQFGGGQAADDIGLALWGLNETMRLMFEATGDELGRAALMNTIESGDAFETKVFPPPQFSADEHFGGTGAHLLAADCDAQMYTTEKQLVEI
jgi:hypothetical protein